MRQAWLRLRKHWVRHLLAIMQVALGIAAVTAVLTDVVPVIDSASVIGEQRLFSVAYGSNGPRGNYRIGAFELSHAELLAEQANSIEAVSVYDTLFSPLIMVDGERYMIRSGAHVGELYNKVADIPIVEGSFFSQADINEELPEVTVISRTLAEQLFQGESAIGKIINLRPDEEASMVRGYGRGALSDTSAAGTDLRVIGVYEAPLELSDSGFFYGGPADLLIPVTQKYRIRIVRPPSAENQAGEGSIPQRNRRFSQLYVRAKEGMVSEAHAEIRTLLSDKLEESARPPGEPEPEIVIEADTASRIQRSRAQGAIPLVAMGLVAAVVAGISIMTTQLASVSERVRQIGMKRALGATRSRIVREIVFESGLLSGLGGVLGVLASYPLGNYLLKPLLSSFRTNSLEVSSLFLASVIGVILAVGIGMVAGLYPGWVAARMEPARAFKGEGF